MHTTYHIRAEISRARLRHAPAAATDANRTTDSPKENSHTMRHAHSSRSPAPASAPPPPRRWTWIPRRTCRKRTGIRGFFHIRAGVPRPRPRRAIEALDRLSSHPTRCGSTRARHHQGELHLTHDRTRDHRGRRPGRTRPSRSDRVTSSVGLRLREANQGRDDLVDSVADLGRRRCDVPHRHRDLDARLRFPSSTECVAVAHQAVRPRVP